MATTTHLISCLPVRQTGTQLTSGGQIFCLHADETRMAVMKIMSLVSLLQQMHSVENRTTQFLPLVSRAVGDKEVTMWWKSNGTYFGAVSNGLLSQRISIVGLPSILETRHLLNAFFLLESSSFKLSESALSINIPLLGGGNTVSDPVSIAHGENLLRKAIDQMNNKKDHAKALALFKRAFDVFSKTMIIERGPYRPASQTYPTLPINSFSGMYDSLRGIGKIFFLNNYFRESHKVYKEAGGIYAQYHWKGDKEISEFLKVLEGLFPIEDEFGENKTAVKVEIAVKPPFEKSIYEKNPKKLPDTPLFPMPDA